jgi:hypothetical protein
MRCLADRPEASLHARLVPREDRHFPQIAAVALVQGGIHLQHLVGRGTRVPLDHRLHSGRTVEHPREEDQGEERQVVCCVGEQSPDVDALFPEAGETLAHRPV